MMNVRLIPVLMAALCAPALTPVHAAPAEAALVQGPQFAVTAADIRADSLRMPPEMRPLVLSRPQTVTQVAGNLYSRRAMAETALSQGLDKDPEVQAALRIARDKVLSDAFLLKLDEKNMPSEAAAEGLARDLYRAKPERFKVPEEVRARHILVEGGDTPEARAEAEKILTELKGGADFAALAREKSIDKGSAVKGGDLGFFGKGKMVPEFEKVAFEDLKNPGDLSGLVKTQFGYHIIQLQERRAAGGVRPFAEVREALIEEVRAAAVQDARVQEAQKAQQGAKLNPEAVKALADSYEAQLKASAAAGKKPAGQPVGQPAGK